MDPIIMIKRTQEQDDEAFIKLIDTCKEKLYRIAFAYLKNEQSSLDAVSQSIYKAYKNINELKSGLTDIESRGGLSILSSDEELFDKLDEDRDETEEMFENITNDDYSFKKYNSNEGGLK